MTEREREREGGKKQGREVKKIKEKRREEKNKSIEEKNRKIAEIRFKTRHH